MPLFENSYFEKLPQKFYHRLNPERVDNPQLIYFNKKLAEELKIAHYFKDKKITASILSGNELQEQSKPIAQAYAGHQFGHFNMLGDGRALLLGEIVSDQKRYDIQLKGSGATKYSRRGDGRATLYSMLREYLISEAMHHLDVQTTRSLAVVKTGESVYREVEHEGAILSRIASSHIRVGTFEYARFFCEKKDLEKLLGYSIQRHYPELNEAENKPLAFLEAVMIRQIDLIVDWMRVGFIHGVINTDNMSIAGETIDYGPCAFMNQYHPGTVFSSIDTEGRYAYGRQPQIAHWNLSVLANALLILIDENEEKAVEKANRILRQFPDIYKQRYIQMMYHKLGIPNKENRINDRLIEELLALLQKYQMDYTNFFVQLENDAFSKNQPSEIQNWIDNWKTPFNQDNEVEKKRLMHQNNPVVIPRNHLVEEVLEEATQNDNFTPFNQLLEQLKMPYSRSHTLQKVPEGYDAQYRTFCGT